MAHEKKSLSMLRRLIGIRKSLARRFERIASLNVNLEEQKKMLRKAKARFKAELRRFDEEHLSEQQYLTISKNLHSFRRIEVAASIEIGNLNGSIAETAEHLDKDEAEASRLEGKLGSIPTICVSSLEEVNFLSESSIPFAQLSIGGWLPGEVKQSIRQICEQRGFRLTKTK